MMESGNIYSYSAELLSGKEHSLANYKDKVVLIVNTASQCGFTPQLAGLEDLYQKYKAKGFAVLAFPCNQFGKQEPGSSDDIMEFCQVNYGVNFPVFAKCEVNGESALPIFDYLTNALPGLMGIKSIKWNFTKFLIDRNGAPVSRHAPQTVPASLSGEIEKLLSQGVD